MQNSKEKVPKVGVSPSVALLVLAVAGTAILSIGVTTTPAAVFQLHLWVMTNQPQASQRIMVRLKKIHS